MLIKVINFLKIQNFLSLFYDFFLYLQTRIIESSFVFLLPHIGQFFEMKMFYFL